MSSVVLLDISRLIWRAHRRAPTGIDRVELAYAQHFIAGESQRPAYAVLHVLGFVFALHPSRGRRFVEAVAARWEQSTASTRWADLRSVLRIYWQLLAGILLFGPSLRRALRTYGGVPIFLVVSHHHLGRAHALNRVRRSLGVRTVCLIHDLIPIDYPEYFKPGWEARYRRLAANLARCFDAIIANSESTARSVRKCLGSESESSAPLTAVCAAPLGVRPFSRTSTSSYKSSEHPYFVVLGTIEPRKNHLLLLNAWARLVSATAEAPRLFVVGARGWENEQVLDMLERSRRLRGAVEERRGLGDIEVGTLLHGARALLLPSLAEGFGLPLAEALASGVPVICSDIPVFREVGLDVPEYLDPLDLQAWMEAVLDYRAPDSHRRTDQLRRLAQWRPPHWVNHFTIVDQLLCDLTSAPRPLAVAGQYQRSMAANN